MTIIEAYDRTLDDLKRRNPGKPSSAEIAAAAGELGDMLRDGTAMFVIGPDGAEFQILDAFTIDELAAELRRDLALDRGDRQPVVTVDVAGGVL